MFTVATYNVLADAYIRPGYFPRTPAKLLASGPRQACLLDRIAALGADVVCLQEVEGPRYAALLSHLGGLGYGGAYAQKGRGKPDGCATFVREATFDLVSMERVPYEDGEPESGHVVQVVVLERDGHRLAVAQTVDQAGGPALFVVIVVALEPTLNLEDLEQPPSPPGVLGRDPIDARKDLSRAVAHVREVADWRSNHVEHTGCHTHLAELVPCRDAASDAREVASHATGSLPTAGRRAPSALWIP